MDLFSPFTGEEYFTHATQDKDHEYRAIDLDIRAIENDNTRIH